MRTSVRATTEQDFLSGHPFAGCAPPPVINPARNREYDALVPALPSAVRRLPITMVVIVAASLFGAACSDDEPELTRADLLAEIEGRSLSEAEIEERESIARALCQMDDDVLRAVWADMDNDQLAFQDFVFTQECGDRNPLYAESTGRFATDN